MQSFSLDERLEIMEEMGVLHEILAPPSDPSSRV